MNIHLDGHNILKSHNEGLESALCVMVQENINLGVLFETNLMGGIYTHHS